MTLPAGETLIGINGSELITAGLKGKITGRGLKHDRLITSGIPDAKYLLATSEKYLYITQAKDDKESTLWMISPDGTKQIMHRQAFGGTHIALYPDHQLLMHTEQHSQWIYSYILNQEGIPEDGQRFYWLHNTDNYSFTENGNMSFDTNGNMYVATLMGVQVCDQNGRVRAILSLPSGAVSSLAFGGKDHDVLYVVSGGTVYRRKMKVKGVQSWSSPMKPVSQGAG